MRTKKNYIQLQGQDTNLLSYVSNTTTSADIFYDALIRDVTLYTWTENGVHIYANKQGSELNHILHCSIFLQRKWLEIDSDKL